MSYTSVNFHGVASIEITEVRTVGATTWREVVATDASGATLSLCLYADNAEALADKTEDARLSHAYSEGRADERAETFAKDLNAQQVVA